MKILLLLWFHQKKTLFFFFLPKSRAIPLSRLPKTLWLNCLPLHPSIKDLHLLHIVQHLLWFQCSAKCIHFMKGLQQGFLLAFYFAGWKPNTGIPSYSHLLGTLIESIELGSDSWHCCLPKNKVLGCFYVLRMSTFRPAKNYYSEAACPYGPGCLILFHWHSSDTRST